MGDQEIVGLEVSVKEERVRHRHRRTRNVSRDGGEQLACDAVFSKKGEYRGLGGT